MDGRIIGTMLRKNEFIAQELARLGIPFTYGIDDNSNQIIIADYDVAALELAYKWHTIRDERTRLLAECDWTQCADVPMNPAKRDAWNTYRQALRDIPQTFPNPSEVKYPDQP